MKTEKSLWGRRVVRAVIIGACINCLSIFGDDTQKQLTASASSASVKEFSGTVQFCNEGGNWRALSVQTILKPGASVRTAPDSSATLLLSDSGSLLRISPGSSFILKPVARPASASRAAIVRSLRGEAQFCASENGSWKALRVGMVIPAGSSVRTHAATTLDLFCRANGLVVRMQPHTALKLKNDDSESDAVMTVDSMIRIDHGVVLAHGHSVASAAGLPADLKVIQIAQQ